MTPADIPLVLMVLVGPLGAFDILYFHLWKFRLYSAPSARIETVTHLVRGGLFAGVAGALTYGRPQGTWFWAVAILVGVDFFNNIADALSEERSRAPLGGLPRLEYVVHVVGSTAAGAISVAFVLTAWSSRTALSGLVPDARPDWLMISGLSLAVGGVALTLLECGLFMRSIMQRGWRPT